MAVRFVDKQINQPRDSVLISASGPKSGPSLDLDSDVESTSIDFNLASESLSFKLLFREAVQTVEGIKNRVACDREELN